MHDKKGDKSETSGASIGCFDMFKKHSDLYSIEVTGEAANEDSTLMK